MNDHRSVKSLAPRRFEPAISLKLVWSGIRPVLVLTLMIFAATAFTDFEQPAIAAVTASAVQVTDLGVLPNGYYSTAQAINNLAQAVGISTDAAQAYQTVIWSGGTITTIGYCCPGGLQRFEAINDLREAVGWENGGYATNGYYWDSNGLAWVLPALPGGENRVHAYDINNSGLIVGESRDGTFDRHAVVWDGTTLVQDLGFMGAASPGLAKYTSARGINDVGDIVGQAVVGSDYHAFLWRNGNFTDLGLGLALDINNNGLVVGWTSGQVPVVWRNGVMENLPALSGEPIGYGHIVTGLNNNGDIVGYAPSPVGTGFRYTAVLWRGGKAINLGFFPGGTSSIAYDINDSGQIVGEGSVVPDGPMHALLWTVGGAANQPPVAKASATPTSGTAPLAVNFSSAGSSDPDGTITSYAWTFGDGGTSTAANPSHNYASAGTFTATLTVTDNSGATASKSVTITATATASVLRSTDITLTATRVLSSVTVTGKVTVKNQSSAVVSGATVAITWKLPNGSTKTATATTNSSGVATFTVKSGRGTYKLTVNNLTKTGYTFDAANSVLTKSITK